MRDKEIETKREREKERTEQRWRIGFDSIETGGGGSSGSGDGEGVGGAVVGSGGYKRKRTHDLREIGAAGKETGQRGSAGDRRKERERETVGNTTHGRRVRRGRKSRREHGSVGRGVSG